MLSILANGFELNMLLPTIHRSPKLQGMHTKAIPLLLIILQFSINGTVSAYESAARGCESAVWLAIGWLAGCVWAHGTPGITQK